MRGVAGADSSSPQRGFEPGGRSNWDGATRALLIAAFVGVVFSYGRFGIAWDEDVQARYGEHVLRYFLSGGEDRGFESHYNLRYYGALFELASAAFHRLLGADRFEHRSLLTALVALSTVAAAAGLGRLLGGARVGALAALALLLMPRFVGHGFVNSKDIPFACGVVWSFYLTARLLMSAHVRRRDVAALGLACGGAMAIRSAAIGLLLFVAVVLAAAVVVRWHAEPIPSQLRRWGPRYAGVVAVAWTVMVAFWPFAHDAPLANPLRAIASGHGSGLGILVRYLGAIQPSSGLPGHYLLWSLLIVTPPATLLFAALGAGHVVARLAARRAWGASEAPASIAFGTLLLWVFGPLVVGLALAPNVYDGIRHILFVLPGLAILAAIGVDRLLARTFDGEDRPGRRTAVAVAGVVLLAATASSAFATRSYPIAYFNFLAGPAETVHERYETDYWVTSYREAAEWVSRRQAQSTRPLHVAIAADFYNATSFTHFVVGGVNLYRTQRPPTGALPEDRDYYVGTTRYDWHLGFSDTPVVHEIRSAGVLLTAIRGHDVAEARTLAP